MAAGYVYCSPYSESWTRFAHKINEIVKVAPQFTWETSWANAAPDGRNHAFAACAIHPYPDDPKAANIGLFPHAGTGVNVVNDDGSVTFLPRPKDGIWRPGYTDNYSNSGNWEWYRTFWWKAARLTSRPDRSARGALRRWTRHTYWESKARRKSTIPLRPRDVFGLY